MRGLPIVTVLAGRTVYGGLDASDEPWHGQPASLRLVLPPLATVVLVPEG